MLLPVENVSVQQDRVQVIIPDELKTKIGFGRSACEKQAPFSSSIQVFYKTSKSFLFIPYNKETSVTYNAFSLSRGEKFVLKTELNGTVKKTTDEPAEFAVSSGEVTYQCEDGNSGAVSYRLPDQAKEINCFAEWVNVSNTTTLVCKLCSWRDYCDSNGYRTRARPRVHSL